MDVDLSVFKLKNEIISRQRFCDFSDWKFGKSGNISKNGCGIVAVYNAMVLLNESYKFEEIYNELNNDGLMNLNFFSKGRMGLKQSAVEKFFKNRGFKIESYHVRNKRKYFPKKHDVYILTYFYKPKSEFAIRAHYKAGIFRNDLFYVFNPNNIFNSFIEGFDDRDYADNSCYEYIGFLKYYGIDMK